MACARQKLCEAQGRKRFRPCIKKVRNWDFPGGAVLKNLPANAGVMGSNPGQGRSHMTQSN